MGFLTDPINGADVGVIQSIANDIPGRGLSDPRPLAEVRASSDVSFGFGWLTHQTQSC